MILLLLATVSVAVCLGALVDVWWGSSVLALDYPGVEVLVVDDRSTDDTPHILARLQAAHPRLRVARVEMLPDGWLGKTHALAFGAARTTGDLLLFTDADVVFAPDRGRAAHHVGAGLLIA